MYMIDCNRVEISFNLNINKCARPLPNNPIPTAILLSLITDQNLTKHLAYYASVGNTNWANFNITNSSLNNIAIYSLNQNSAGSPVFSACVQENTNTALLLWTQYHYRANADTWNLSASVDGWTNVTADEFNGIRSNGVFLMNGGNGSSPRVVSICFRKNPTMHSPWMNSSCPNFSLPNNPYTLTQNSTASTLLDNIASLTRVTNSLFATSLIPTISSVSSISLSSTSDILTSTSSSSSIISSIQSSSFNLLQTTSIVSSLLKANSLITSSALDLNPTSSYFITSSLDLQEDLTLTSSFEDLIPTSSLRLVSTSSPQPTSSSPLPIVSVTVIPTSSLDLQEDLIPTSSLDLISTNSLQPTSSSPLPIISVTVIPTSSLDLQEDIIPTSSIDLQEDLIPTSSLDLISTNSLQPTSSSPLPIVSVTVIPTNSYLVTSSLDLQEDLIPTSSLDLQEEDLIPTSSLELISTSSPQPTSSSPLPIVSVTIIPTSSYLVTSSLDLQKDIIPTSSLDLISTNSPQPTSSSPLPIISVTIIPTSSYLVTSSLDFQEDLIPTSSLDLIFTSSLHLTSWSTLQIASVATISTSSFFAISSSLKSPTYTSSSLFTSSPLLISSSLPTSSITLSNPPTASTSFFSIFSNLFISDSSISSSTNIFSSSIVPDRNSFTSSILSIFPTTTEHNPLTPTSSLFPIKTCKRDGPWPETQVEQTANGTCHKGIFNGTKVRYIVLIFLFIIIATRYCKANGNWDIVNCNSSTRFHNILEEVQ